MLIRNVPGCNQSQKDLSEILDADHLLPIPRLAKIRLFDDGPPPILVALPAEHLGHHSSTYDFQPQGANLKTKISVLLDVV